MMKDEYDFSNAERGKFYKADATLNLPVYLNAEILNYFAEKAKLKGVKLNDLLNDVLQKDIDELEDIKSQNNS